MLRLDPSNIEEVVRLINEGHVVAIPTDTVYGVAARADLPDAVAQLFAIKKRPTNVALPVLVSSTEMIDELGGRLPASAQTLANAMWPGPLTLIVPTTKALAERVGSTTSTVGFRIPNESLTLQLLQACGALAVTSANEHGEPPCTSADEVIAAFGEASGVAAVMDGGVRNGVVSTVVRCDEQGYDVVRSGALSGDDLAGVFR